MRVLHQDRRSGQIKVQIDSLDDMWHLYNILKEGDLVTAATYRREEVKSDKIRSERGEKKKMTLGIRVEKVEFHESESRLRVLGVIEEGPQDLGSHHTLNLQEGEVITITKKDWTDANLQRIRRAVEDARRPRIVFVSIEYDEALVAVLKQFGVQEVARILGLSSGKMYEQKEGNDFYGEVAEKVRQVAGEGTPVVVLGPGFAKEALVAEGKSRFPEVFNRSFVFHTGQAGMPGIHELMKRGVGAEVLEESRVALEMKLVEDLLTEISKEGMVAYGPSEVERAVGAGAVVTLLILDSLMRQKDMDPLIKAVEEARGSVVIVSDRHEAGKKLEALGGVAALLRFRVS